MIYPSTAAERVADLNSSQHDRCAKRGFFGEDGKLVPHAYAEAGGWAWGECVCGWTRDAKIHDV